MTPQPAIVGIARSLGATHPPVPMCSQCGFAQVDEPGKVCRTCVGIIANREQLDVERQKRRTFFWRAFVVVAILIGSAIVAEVWK